MSETILAEIPLEEIREYCERQPIRRLSVFGSAARNELTPESDVDLLVEYRPGTRVTLLTLAGHEIDLGNLIGRKVDLRMEGELRETFRQQVIDSARPIYEKKS